MVSDPSLYNIVNFLTLGTLDTISGALNPEDPWSLEHWLDIVGTLLTAYAAYATATGVKQALTGSVDDAMRAPGTLVDDVVDDITRSAGLTKEQINAIINIPKGQRPDPSTYLTQEYIDQHLDMFRNGVTKFYAKLPPVQSAHPTGPLYFLRLLLTISSHRQIAMLPFLNNYSASTQDTSAAPLSELIYLSQRV